MVALMRNPENFQTPWTTLIMIHDCILLRARKKKSQIKKDDVYYFDKPSEKDFGRF